MADTKPLCPHESFYGNFNINRFEDTGRFSADITIKCATCGEPFRFLGLAAGLDFDKPMVSIDGLELRAPIQPQGEPQLLGHATFVMPSIPVRN